uniref:Mediator of RNA polymerase II transcription subunit 6 n=1 Tax=Albugo laibachii Nc14 TaxID=890382 RepID=F0VYK4_9STRA|nr:mediator of RNA polymerase II transcription subunit putative [Albugo laibachii Nc14]|eukprot:CCA13868.1 mediator of RNA polymerase II transcription subunit putative [Albugo laibachii Nc14]
MQRLSTDQLKNMRGIEYEVVPNTAKQLPQQIFGIRKQRREGRTQVKLMAIYYVLEGTVYQAPNVHAMLSSRLRTCSFRVGKAFRMLNKGVRFSPSEGYSWDFSTLEKKAPVIPSELLQLKLKQTHEKMERKKEQSTRVDAIIVQLMKKYAPEMIGKVEFKDEPHPEMQIKDQMKTQ